MYILPNKKPINMDKIEEAFNDFDIKNRYYLDIENGEVILSGEDNRVELTFMENTRYYSSPKLSTGVKIKWMKNFADDMLYMESPELCVKLRKALEEENPAEKFMAILEPDESGWIHGWAQWEADNLYEEIIDWFCSLPIDIEDDMSELDDDCPLCRMMKEGVNDMETLKGGFQEIKAKQMVDNIFRRANSNKK